MTVILGIAVAVNMQVATAIVIMVMEMPPFPNQFHAEQTAEDDKHDADDAFCRRRKRLWDRHTEHEDDRSHEEQDGGMAHAPAQADQARRAPGGPLGEHRRDGCKMVRIQGVTQSKDETEPENGEIGRISHAAPITIRRRPSGETCVA